MKITGLFFSARRRRHLQRRRSATTARASRSRLPRPDRTVMPSAGPATARPERSARLLLGLAAVAVDVRGRRHLRRGARAARHDGLGRAERRRSSSGRPRSCQRLPARVRRDAAADRPDRRPARPHAGAGRRRWSCSPSARWSPRRRTTSARWSSAASCRASAAAGWSRSTLALVADLYPAERRGVPARRRRRGPGARQRARSAVRRRGARRRRPGATSSGSTSPSASSSPPPS